MTRSAKTSATACAVAWALLAALVVLVLPGCGDVSPATAARAGAAGSDLQSDGGGVGAQGGNSVQDAGLDVLQSLPDVGSAQGGSSGCGAPTILAVGWATGTSRPLADGSFDFQPVGDCKAAGGNVVQQVDVSVDGAPYQFPCSAGTVRIPVSPGPHVLAFSLETLEPAPTYAQAELTASGWVEADGPRQVSARACAETAVFVGFATDRSK